VMICDSRQPTRFFKSLFYLSNYWIFR